MIVVRKYVQITSAALLAGLAVLSLGLSTPARAADVKSPRDAASGMPTGKRQHEPVSPGDNPSVAEAEAKFDEAEALLASINDQMTQLQKLIKDLHSTANVVDVERIADIGNKVAQSDQIEEAQKIFDEQVASLLDASVVTAVTQQLDALLAGTQDVASGGDISLADDVSPLLDELSSLSQMLATFTETCASSKKEFKGHVTLLK